ncbi:MAG: BMP family protein [Anaerolineae bacterium]|nr:BMP family protein [Gemmatimonadaceae bacterium]
MHYDVAKNSTLATAVLALGILSSACSPAGENADVGKDVFRVAVLTPGPITDQSWNAGAYAGLLGIRDSLSALTSHIQVKTPAEFEENFEQYGSQGYDLVFGHGFEFQDAAERVGRKFPQTVYITTSGNRVAPNVSPMVFGLEEPAYLAGVMAGALTRSGIISTIGGTELPPVKSLFLAFIAGARSVKPDVRVLGSYVGNWDDASAGKEQALAQIQQGSDFIFQNADAAGLGTFQAAREVRGVYVFGANSNQNAVAPDVIIASVVIDLPQAFLSVAREVKERRFTSRVIRFGASSGVVKLVQNPELAHLLKPPLRLRMDSVQRLMSSGKIVPPRLDFVDTSGPSSK